MTDRKSLTAEEQEIEDLLGSADLCSPENKTLIEEKLQVAAKNYQKKDARINIRLSSADLSKLKRRASREGIPYQTMIAGILHKVANGLLSEERKQD